MSTIAKATLAASCVTTAGIVGYVHYKQELDRFYFIFYIIYNVYENCTVSSLV